MLKFVQNICLHMQAICAWSSDIRNKFANLKIPLKHQNKEISLRCVATKSKNSGETNLVKDDEQTTLSFSSGINLFFKACFLSCTTKFKCQHPRDHKQRATCTSGLFYNVLRSTIIYLHYKGISFREHSKIVFPKHANKRKSIALDHRAIDRDLYCKTVFCSTLVLQ